MSIFDPDPVSQLTRIAEESGFGSEAEFAEDDEDRPPDDVYLADLNEGKWRDKEFDNV